MSILSGWTNALTALCLGLLAAPVGHANTQNVPAHWKLQELKLDHYQENGAWDCEAYERLVERILRTVGAHRATNVDARCARTLSGNFTVSIFTATLTTGEGASQTNEDERIMTVMGVQELSATVKATWKTFNLARAPRLRLEQDHCRVVEELTRSVFPALGVTVAKPLVCPSMAVRVPLPRIEVTALLPIETEQP